MEGGGLADSAPAKKTCCFAALEEGVRPMNLVAYNLAECVFMGLIIGHNALQPYIFGTFAGVPVEQLGEEAATAPRGRCAPR